MWVVLQDPTSSHRPRAEQPPCLHQQGTKPVGASWANQLLWWLPKASKQGQLFLLFGFRWWRSQLRHCQAPRGAWASKTWWRHQVGFCAWFLNIACRKVEFKSLLSIDLTVLPQESIYFHYLDQWHQCWVLWNSPVQVFREARAGFKVSIYTTNENSSAKPDSWKSNKYYGQGLMTAACLCPPAGYGRLSWGW